MLPIKIKSILSVRRSLAIIGLAVLISIKLTGILTAQSVTRGYGSDQILQRGMIVGVQKSDPNKVEPINTPRLKTILGIVVNPNDSPITVSSDNQHVFVATSGRYDVLVSDQQGAIGINDYITLSSIAGIGMKANDQQSNILGRASATFDGKNNVLSSMVLSDSKGNQRSVHIGRIRVDIAIDRNPLMKNNNGAPAILSRAGSAISGKTVSAVRLYLSAIVFIVGTLTAGAMLYAGIRSSIISIGRNPLSKKSIFRSMIGVAFTSIIVFIISVIGVYLLLKL